MPASSHARFSRSRLRPGIGHPPGDHPHHLGDLFEMTSLCPQCRSSVDPASGSCRSCGVIFEPSDLDDEAGFRLESGETGCPAAFGPYRVLGILGRGGMGVVYLGRHEVTHEEVAIKTVRLRKQDLLHRIRREVDALARISHPGLVRIIQTGQAEGLPWYAMELLRGTTLHDRLRQTGPGARRLGLGSPTMGVGETSADFALDGDHADESPRIPEGATFAIDGPNSLVSSGETLSGSNQISSEDPTNEVSVFPTAFGSKTGFGPGPDLADAPRLSDRFPIPEGQRKDFLILMARLCRTLAYLHGEGIVHRDIKPQNVIIRPDGTPVLLDFGLSSFFSTRSRESLDLTGKVEGTPEYMSPEQVRGEIVDARADLYAIGCILYEGVTGRVPFHAVSANGTLRAQVKIPPIPPRHLVSDLPEELDAVILGLLAKRVGDRVGYARDVEDALTRMGCDPGDWAADRQARDYLYHSGFVGRSAVLASLEAQIARVLKRPGHGLFLRGPSGVGKTRLILELARRLEQSGRTVMTGECLPIGVDLEGSDGPGVRATPLHPFRTLLQVIADACLERGPEEAARLLGPRAKILAETEPILASLPGLDLDESEPCLDPLDESRKTRLVEALGDTIAEFARDSPVVILLDDFQWADALTLHFLALFHVGAWDSPNVAIVVAYRSEEEDDAIKGYRPVFHDATFVEIGPLGDDCLGEIIRGMLGSEEADDWCVDHLVRRSRGNPFFAAESLRAAVTEGLLRRDASGVWRARNARGELADPKTIDAALPLPDSIHELVVRRLGRLPADALLLLELAAVFGREVDAGLIEAVGLLGESESMAALETLRVAQVLEESRDGLFRFNHDKLREVAYEQIPPHRRRELHRTVAQAIERRHVRRDDLCRQYATLAHHWYRAIEDRSGDPLARDRAIDYLEKAVGHAVNIGLPSDAVGFGRAAARLLGIELPDDPVEVAAAMTAEMNSIRASLQGRSPSELLDLPGTGDPESDRVIGMLLTTHPPAFLSNQFGLFALMASKNLNLTLDHGPGALAPAVYGMYAIVTRIILDDARTAHEFGRLAIELDRRRGGSMAADVLFVNQWFLNHWVAPIAESLVDSEDGPTAGARSGSVLYRCYNQAAEVVLLAASGASLRKVIEAAEVRLKRIGRRVLVARFHCVLERQFALALEGRTEDPTSLTDGSFDEARDLAFICRTTNANPVGYYHTARAKLHYYRGEYPDALGATDQALAVRDSFARQIVEIDLVFFRALTLLAIASEETGHARQTRVGESRELLSTLHRWRADAEANFGHKAILVEAELARIEGRDAEATRLFEESAQAADRYRFLPHAALAHERAGHHFEQLGQEMAAREAWQRAAEGYRAWGASTLADRLDQVSKSNDQ